MVAVASSTPTGGNFFSKFIFPGFICLTDLLSDFLSDLLIVKNSEKDSSPFHCNCDNYYDILDNFEFELSLSTGFNTWGYSG